MEEKIGQEKETEHKRKKKKMENKKREPVGCRPYLDQGNKIVDEKEGT
jgi:hypothetical protein